MNIVCYMGGTCGDLVSALIDSTGVTFKNYTVQHVHDRIKLKKPYLFENIEQKDQYLTEIKNLYNSISSHDLAYHMERKHDIIGITVKDPKIALWAAKRFKKLHQPSVWEKISQSNNIHNVEQYAQLMIDFSHLIVQHTNKIVTLESIVGRRVFDDLIPLIPTADTRRHCNLYQNWLHFLGNYS